MDMRQRHAFTMIELLTVIAVMAMLGGIVLAAGWALIRDQRDQATQALLDSVQNAIASSDRTTVKYQAADGSISTHFLFDFDEDGLLDGRPEDDFDDTAADDAAALVPPYRGFILETGFTAMSQVDERTGALLDAWGRRLKIQYKPGLDVSGVVVQSAGTDGTWDTDDDLYSGEGGKE